MLKCFKSKNPSVLLHLFKTYVRPKLEFNTCVWSPFLKKDIIRIESVQRHFTRSVFLKCGLPLLSYSKRLKKLNLKSLEERRLFFDLILVYKIVHGMSDLNFNDYFVLAVTGYNLRRNTIQIKALRSHKNDQWRNSFFHRMPNIWNSLPDEVVRTPTLSCFKSRLKTVNLIPFLKIFQDHDQK